MPQMKTTKSVLNRAALASQLYSQVMAASREPARDFDVPSQIVGPTLLSRMEYIQQSLKQG